MTIENKSHANDLPESIKLKMLSDADYHLQPLHKNYIRLVDFLHWLRQQSCELIAGKDCAPCYAKEILEKIGEL